MSGAQTDIRNNDSKTAFDLAKDAETSALLQHAGELETRDVPDIRLRLAGYPAIFSNPVPFPAKTVPGTGYLSRIVIGLFWQLVELSSPSEWAPYCKTVGLHDSLVMSHVDQLFYIY